MSFQYIMRTQIFADAVHIDCGISEIAISIIGKTMQIWIVERNPIPNAISKQFEQ